MKLRLRGYSYNEIHAKLHIPKSTLGTWFRDLALSSSARDRLASREKAGSLVLVRRNRLQTHLAEQRAHLKQKEGASVVLKNTNSNLLFVGAALYWAEGYKRLKVRDGRKRMSHTINFVNADPEMVQLFIRFLNKILGISITDIRFVMRLYPHINEQSALRYWSRISGAPKERFFKSTFLVSGASKGRRPFNQLPWGTLQVEVCNTQKFHYLMGLIEGVKKYLLHGTVGILPR